MNSEQIKNLIEDAQSDWTKLVKILPETQDSSKFTPKSKPIWFLIYWIGQKQASEYTFSWSFFGFGAQNARI